MELDLRNERDAVSLPSREAWIEMQSAPVMGTLYTVASLAGSVD